MRILVHAVGRMKAGPEKELADRFFDRFARSGPALGFDFRGVSETVESRAPTVAERLREEALRLAAQRDAVLVLLDERGRNITSQTFASTLADMRDTGTREAVFAIGGPDGHDESLRERATLLWSFGSLTWPHQIVRILLAEQLYRAATILSGHPYHRA